MGPHGQDHQEINIPQSFHHGPLMRIAKETEETRSNDVQSTNLSLNPKFPIARQPSKHLHLQNFLSILA